MSISQTGLYYFTHDKQLDIVIQQNQQAPKQLMRKKSIALLCLEVVLHLGLVKKVDDHSRQFATDFSYFSHCTTIARLSSFQINKQNKEQQKVSLNCYCIMTRRKYNGQLGMDFIQQFQPAALNCHNRIQVSSSPQDIPSSRLFNA